MGAHQSLPLRHTIRHHTNCKYGTQLIVAANRSAVDQYLHYIGSTGVSFSHHCLLHLHLFQSVEGLDFTIPLSNVIKSFISSVDKMPPKKKSKAEEGKSKKEDEKKEEPEEESEEEEPEGDESKAKAADEEDHGRGKRKRRSSVENSFEPVDFTMQGDGKSGVKIIKGRGKALKEFPSVVASIEKRSTEDVLFGHKFLFGNRGSNLKKKELINNLLEFSGYLKAVPKGYDAEKLDAEDEIEEVRRHVVFDDCGGLVIIFSHYS